MVFFSFSVLSPLQEPKIHLSFLCLLQDETISENVEERSDFNVEVKFEENEIKNEQLDEDGIGIGNAIGSSGDGDGDGDRDGDREVGGGGAFGDSGIGLERRLFLFY